MITQLAKSLALGGLLCFLGCRSTTQPKTSFVKADDDFSLFSTAIKDSFYIQTQVPTEYKDSTAKRYPVVVLLDANFYFPMLAASMRQYEKAGLLPPLILVGIGYRSFNDMDSLRTRDYLYPAALPSDELTTVGGGERFRQFVSNDLLTIIDQHSELPGMIDRCLATRSVGISPCIRYWLRRRLEREHSKTSSQPALRFGITISI